MNTRQCFYSWVFAVGALTLGSQAGATGVPSFVKDLTVQPADSGLAGLTRAGDNVFFAAEESVHGLELWKTDGTPEGSALVKDINPGTEWAFYSRQNLGFTELNGVLFFTADDGTHGRELWKSDGTETGTIMVKDIHPSGNSNPSGMFVFKNKLFFSANNGTNGNELWESDGTESGTVMVKDIDPSGGSSPGEMFEFVNTLFFAASDGTNGIELWKSDGTEAGTVMVMDINPKGHSFPREMVLFDGRIFFSANDGVNGQELWSTDGTEANTTMFLDIHFTGSSNPMHLAAINGLLYFSAGDTTTGPEPWVSNGLPNWGSDTRRFAKPNPYLSSLPSGFTEYNGRVYFTARGGADTGSIWRTDGERSDGSPQSVVPVASPTLPAKISIWGDKLIFLSDDIWISNGTPEGSVPASDQYPDKLVGVTGEAVELNGVFITVGYDEAHGNELWRFDPAGAEPALLKDIHAGTTRSRFGPNSGDSTFVDIDGVGFFVAASDPDGGPMDTGDELWKSDGTEVGTSLVKDINPGDAASNPKDFVKMNGLLFFTADDGTHGRELWKSDGSEAGTVLVKDITDTHPFDTEFGNFSVVDGTLFFSAKNFSMYSMLWKSDGTEEGTVLVKEIFPGARNLYIGQMVAFQELLFFAAMDDNVVKMELWTSDGTEAGTTLFKDINESDSSFPMRFMVMGDTLYFTAALVWGDGELWKTDGTPAGTVLVKDINPTEGSSPGNLISFHNTLFFTADDGTNGKGLWTTDGTAGGTKMINGVFPGSQAYRLAGLIAGDDFMLFVASETSLSSDTQLWRSDGTEAGTRRIEITLPGEAEVGYWSVDQFTRAHGTIYFTMEDETHGEELWSTDGTDAGTQLLIDLYPGSTGSNPRILSVIGERGTAAETLLFSADDYFHSYELWKVAGGASLRPASFAEWKEAQFTPEQLTDSLISGPDGDPDGDGITNLGEYVHGGSPNRVDANPVGILPLNDAQGQIRSVTVTFPWSRGMTDVGYELQISTDLGSWELLESGVINVASQGDADLITLRAEPPDIGAIEVFVRLRVFEL